MAERIPDGYHRVREHIRRNPSPRRRKQISGWGLLAVVAVVLWLWAKGNEGSTSGEPPSAPTPSVSASASVAGR